MPFPFLIFVTLISLTDPAGWKTLSFGSVAPNEVTFDDEQLKIEVDRSASPLLHLFPERRSVRSLKITGRVTGEWNFPTASSWSESPDDALLRVGLIENGTRRLNALERIAAPDWIKEIEQFSSGTADGVGKIRCFHLMPDDSWIGESRVNPQADIFLESVRASPDADGRFEMTVQLDTPTDTVGLWLLADGDDSDASFTVSIESLELGVAP